MNGVSSNTLGTLISSDGRNNAEIVSRLAQAKNNQQISILTRRRALGGFIKPILMYGCEAKTISKQLKKKLEAT